MDELLWLVVFAVDQQRFAVPLACVRQVVMAAEPTALPEAPAAVCGLLDFHGEPIAVIDLGRRLGGARRVLSPDHQFVIVDVPGRALALWVDETLGVVHHAAHALDPATQAASNAFRGAAGIDGNLVLIHDVEAFLQAGESALLDAALQAASPGLGFGTESEPESESGTRGSRS